jgi:hypothetical protein
MDSVIIHRLVHPIGDAPLVIQAKTAPKVREIDHPAEKRLNKAPARTGPRGVVAFHDSARWKSLPP